MPSLKNKKFEITNSLTTNNETISFANKIQIQKINSEKLLIKKNIPLIFEDKIKRSLSIKVKGFRSPKIDNKEKQKDLISKNNCSISKINA